MRTVISGVFGREHSGGRVARRGLCRLAAALVVICTHLAPPAVVASDASILPLVKPEQRRIRYRDPASLPQVRTPVTPPPTTVANPLPADAVRLISLDEAIRIALADSEVIRLLAGEVAVASGRTIYDPAIANNVVDQRRAAFDPSLNVDNTWSQTEPAALPGAPNVFTTENHNLSFDLSQRNLSGGLSRLRFGNDASRFSPGNFALNPQNRYATEFSYTQPLLRGRGVCANRVPIVLARIDTERSFFQLNAGVQELVRSVIGAYWGLVFARTDLWAREIQVQQSEESYNLADARQRNDLANVGEASQARSALANFRASLITARAAVLQREAALQSILGLPPASPVRLVPTTPPTRRTDRLQLGRSRTDRAGPAA